MIAGAKQIKDREGAYLEIDSDGNRFFYCDENFSIRHREYGPACEYKNGNSSWFWFGKRHRLNGPAWEWRTGSLGEEKYYQNNLLHCETGPAFLEWRDGWMLRCIHFYHDLWHHDSIPAYTSRLDNRLYEFFHIHGFAFTKKEFLDTNFRIQKIEAENKKLLDYLSQDEFETDRKWKKLIERFKEPVTDPVVLEEIKNHSEHIQKVKLHQNDLSLWLERNRHVIL